MKKDVITFVICFLFTTVQSKEPELPICPANINYFPHNLPMHCRMPANADYNYPTIPPFPSNFYSLAPEKFPESLPGLPGPPLPPMPMPMPMPMQMPMPMPPMAAPAQKLPVVVMPLYSPEKPFQKKKEKRHKRPHHNIEDSTDTSTEDFSDSSSEDQGWWRRSNTIKKPHHHHRHPRHNTRRKSYQKKELITPMLQYVTKDGYVIFEKQLSKGEESDWMHMQRDNENHDETSHHMEEPEQESEEFKEGTHNKNVIRIEKPKPDIKIDKGLRKHQKKQLKINSAN